MRWGGARHGMQDGIKMVSIWDQYGLNMENWTGSDWLDWRCLDSENT